jgi:hypothetical protein
MPGTMTMTVVVCVAVAVATVVVATGIPFRAAIVVTIGIRYR